MNRTSKLAALALAGTLSVTALAAPAISDSFSSGAADQSLTVAASDTTSTGTGTGTSTSEQTRVGAPMASTGITVQITNTTGQTLTLVDEYKGYGTWGNHFPATIETGQSVSANATSWEVNGVNLSAHYTTADGDVFYVAAYVPLAGANSTVQAVTGPSAALYRITHNTISGAGYHPTATFTFTHI